MRALCFRMDRVKLLGNLPYNIFERPDLEVPCASKPYLTMVVYITKGDGNASFRKAIDS